MNGGWWIVNYDVYFLSRKGVGGDIVTPAYSLVKATVYTQVI